MAKIAKLNRWQLRLGSFTGLVVGYLLASLALDSGSWWHYLGAFVALIVTIKLFVKSFTVQNKDHN